MFIRFFRKLFLVREISSKTGELHFQRYRILETPWFNVYIHYIAKSDEDKDPHNHPWNFRTYVLSGGYLESLYLQFYMSEHKDKRHKRVLYNRYWHLPFCNTNPFQSRTNEYHRIKLIKPTWTLVITGPRINENWGYLLENDTVLDFKEYRKEKNK